MTSSVCLTLCSCDTQPRCGNTFPLLAVSNERAELYFDNHYCCHCCYYFNSQCRHLAADLLGFLRGSVQLVPTPALQGFCIVCLWLFGGGRMRVLLLLLKHLLGGRGSAAVSLGNINARKHFSEGITSSCTYFIISPQI